MEIILEIIFSFFGEFLLQILAELLIEFGFQSLVNTIIERKERNPYLAFIGYCLLGLIVGAISIAIFPVLFIEGKTLILINLGITPIFAGFAMSALGKWRSKRDKELIRLDTFLYGFAFAFCMALVRFGFGDVSV